MRALRSFDPEREDLAAAAASLAALAAGNELVVLQAGDGDALELALRNALPERDVVTVLTDVVVSPDDPASAPHAIPAVRSVRLLLGAGAIVICATSRPLTVDAAGRMRETEGRVELGPTADLLARRLDAERVLPAGAA
jgi:carbamate kinase